MTGAVAAIAGAVSGGGATLVLHDTSYSSDTSVSGGGTASFELNSDGTAVGAELGSNLSYNWRTGGNSADYEVRAMLTSGTFSSGTAGSWLNLGTSRSWSVSRNSIGSKTAQALFEIRHVSNATVLADATIDFQATYVP